MLLVSIALVESSRYIKNNISVTEETVFNEKIDLFNY